MQKIKLIEIKPTGDGEYSVYLGNGTTHKFTSKKQAARFLSTVNKFLTSKLYDLHDLYGDILQRYNDCWAYLDNEPNKARNLRAELETCETSLSKAIVRSGLTDGNAWAFIHLLKASCSLKNIALQLDKEYLKRSLAHQRYQVDNLLNRLQVLETELNTYGQRTADVISMPQHITSMQAAG